MPCPPEIELVWLIIKRAVDGRDIYITHFRRAGLRKRKVNLRRGQPGTGGIFAPYIVYHGTSYMKMYRSYLAEQPRAVHAIVLGRELLHGGVVGEVVPQVSLLLALLPLARPPPLSVSRAASFRRAPPAQQPVRTRGGTLLGGRLGGGGGGQTPLIAWSQENMPGVNIYTYSRLSFS